MAVSSDRVCIMQHHPSDETACFFCPIYSKCAKVHIMGTSKNSFFREAGFDWSFF